VVPATQERKDVVTIISDNRRVEVAQSVHDAGRYQAN